MPNLPNSIGTGGSLMAAIIDPAYTPLNIFQYWLQVAAAFPYLGPDPLNREELTWDHAQLMATRQSTATTHVPQPVIKKSGNAEILEAYFAIPFYKPGVQLADELITAFMLPQLPEADHPTLGRRPAAPVKLHVIRNIIQEAPYCWFSVDINPGTWGYRHLQYKAIEEVFQFLGNMDGGTPQEGETARQAAQLSAQLQAWETKEIAFPRIREQLWT